MILNFPIQLMLYHIYILLTPLYQQYNLKEYMSYKRYRTTMKKSCVGYFMFYNKNDLHYKVKDHSRLDITNKDVLMECVFFVFVFFSYQDKTSLGR